METLLLIFWILLGLALLWFSANWLVASSAAIARRLRIPEAVIGGTVVALGTSMPEVVATGLAAYRGNAGIAIGNVVGSNICNILLILGLAAFMRKKGKPLRPSKSVLSHDGMWLVVVTTILGVFLGLKLGMNDADVAASGSNVILTAAEGWILIGLYGCFILTTVWRSLKARSEPTEIDATLYPQAVPDRPAGSDTEASDVSSGMELRRPRHWLGDVGLMLASITLLAVGADRLVEGAAGIATNIGISQLVIGLTVVAVGTSLPELATTLIAGKKSRDDLAVANITGSNVQNILICLGLALVLVPAGFVPVADEVASRDFWVMAIATAALLFPLSWSGKLGRVWGGMMLVCYLAYVVWLIVGVS